ncbi:hypothetical protein [uncultured Nonlabens sp.]|uniref:hypothetical protein n=1 Tax=uncultured Nonlabens sp. TaxID=859306 RepID=UPI002638CAD8|nr:hypothetical protein [uncultured Nonlabens sp.]
MEFLKDNIEVIVGGIVALAAIGVVIKVKSKNNNRVKQKNIDTYGGDVVGRDKNKD